MTDLRALALTARLRLSLAAMAASTVQWRSDWGARVPRLPFGGGLARRTRRPWQRSGQLVLG